MSHEGIAIIHMIYKGTWLALGGTIGIEGRTIVFIDIVAIGRHGLVGYFGIIKSQRIRPEPSIIMPGIAVHPSQPCGTFTDFIVGGTATNRAFG